MTKAELLIAFKKAEGYSGSDFDDVINTKIDFVIDYLKNSGLSNSQIYSYTGAECIMRGIADVWRQDNPQFSNLFFNMVAQLRARSR